MKTSNVILAFALVPTLAAAQAITLDTSELRPGPVTVTSAGDAVTVAWSDETSRAWRATFSLDPAAAADHVDRRRRRAAVVSDARPVLPGRNGQTARGMERVLRRSRRAIPMARGTCKARSPARAPSAQPSAIASSSCSTACAWAASRARSSYTFYPGSRLIQQEAVLTTNDPDVAYYYDAGLDMSAPADRTAGNNMQSEIAYYDTSGALKRDVHNGTPGRARAGEGPLPHARGEDGRRQRRRLSGAASVFLSARFLLEPRVSLASTAGAAASASASGSCATRTGSTTRG